MLNSTPKPLRSQCEKKPFILVYFSIFLGLYPPTGNSVWDKDLMWQPIPVHTVPEKDDELLAMKKPCMAFDKEKEKYIHSKAYKERLIKYQPLMK